LQKNTCLPLIFFCKIKLKIPPGTYVIDFDTYVIGLDTKLIGFASFDITLSRIPG
jgi:hypothetical protein